MVYFNAKENNVSEVIGQVKIFGAKEVLKKLLEQPEKTNAALKLAVRDTTVMLERTVKRLAPHKSGALMRSIMSSFKDEGLTGFVGTNIAYAAIQEFGGTVTPRVARNLTIPLNRQAELTTCRRFIEAHPKQTFFREKNGRLFLFFNPSKGAPPRAMYMLVPSVKIKGRPYLRPALQATRPYFAQKVSDYVSRA